MPLEAGARLGPYEITALIGKGGMGEVYKARDPRVGRDVAIKISAQQFSERFDREARAIAALNHPNICTLYDVGPNYLVMEFVEGESPKGPMDVGDALRITEQIAAALEAAHEKGITHRDLKPSNVMVKPDGLVKVLDFGLAKVTPETPSQSDATLTLGATQPGAVMGTPAYMAPEQARGKPADRRADIWAFGVLLYELITGKRLFQGEDLTEVLASVVKEQPDLTSVPRPVRRLIEECLRKDPAKRLQAIGDRRLLLGPESGAGSPAQAPSLPHKGLWGAVGVLAIVGAGLGVVAWGRFNEEPARAVKLQFAPPENGFIDITQGPSVAVSPDGRRIVFRASVEGKTGLWIRELDSLSTRLLPGTDAGTGPFWAPDSRNLGFFRQGKMMRIDVTGGPAITICNADQGRGGTWSQEDVIVFSPTASAPLSRVAAAGGASAPLLELAATRAEQSQRFPWFLPDGKHYLYTSRSSNEENNGIYISDLDSKSSKLIVAAGSNGVYVTSGHLLYVRERTLMVQPFDASNLETTGDAVPIAEQVDYRGGAQVYGYFGASQNGVLAFTSGGTTGALQISWYDRNGRVLDKVGKPFDIQTPRLSPDGKTVATDRADAATSNRDIWLLDLIRGTEQRLTFADNNTYPVWSPDGKRLAYSRRPGNKVVVKAADGTGAEEELESAEKLPMDWTRDGRYLLLATPNNLPKTGNDIWSLPLSPEKPGAADKPLALRQTEFAEWHPRVSPDGRWLAYDTNESKQKEIAVVGFPSLDGHYQISTGGGRYPVWSRDGRELYYVSLDAKMMAVEIKPGPTFQAGVPKTLFDVRLGPSNPTFDVSADGRFLIASPMEESATVPMTVVLNWQAALKK